MAIILGIREMRRVLLPDGRLYVGLLDHDDAEYGQGVELETNRYLAEDGVPIHFSSRDEVDKLFQDFMVERRARPKRGHRIIWEIWARKKPT